ncbi:hypothetical protein NEMIN01_0691 [Nematocida minor]|uniref:uncharacterized protein n=1 Tax=Nematocida minor TaxID=1912983 RepID=UPI00221F1937|nr:uncharacterized protein NEMIN01_0691 [Nematocida minor]KAI5189828.1 hypothetical protein NEMIN01_0691 [Nematocida minor]
MKNWKIRQLLNSGMLLALLAMRCRGSEDAFSKEIRDYTGPGEDKDKGMEIVGDLYLSSANLLMDAELARDGMESHYIREEQYTAQPETGEDIFNEEMSSTLSTLGSEYELKDESLDLDFMNLDKDVSIWNGLDTFRTVESMAQCYNLPEHSGHSPEIASTSGSFLKGAEDSGAKLRIGKKRKKSNDLLEERKVKRKPRNKRCAVQHRQSVQHITTDDDEHIGLDAEPCDDGTKFRNTRRKGYRLKKKTIYRHNINEKNMRKKVKAPAYQEKLQKDIQSFSAQPVPETEKNALWYFIAYVTTTINTRYKALFGLQELLKNGKYRKILEGLKGYYPGAVNDLIEYIQKHRPIRSGNENCLFRCNETLGDIYMREDLELNSYSPEEDRIFSQMDKKYHALACAVRMVLVLPEVYTDFSNISSEFIEQIGALDDSDASKENRWLLFKIQEIAYMHAAEKIDITVYEELYSVFADMHTEEVMEKLTASELYRNMYVLLANFYEKADMVDRKTQHVLVGKCIIANQKYMRSEIEVDIAPTESNKRVLSSDYSCKENKWGISSGVCAHYHVLYVNNATKQTRRLCMPMYVDNGGKEHYLHTVDAIVKYIEDLYAMEKRQALVHPFKVRKGTRLWSYIDKKDRDMTVQDLEEYKVVFYHIEENLEETGLTFAELRPLRPQSKSSIGIPLFLTPLMRSAVELGPFDKTGEHAEMFSIDFEDREPDVYTYSSKYKDEKCSDVHGYYSNLYITDNTEKKESADCYIMECGLTKQGENIVQAAWHAKMESSVDAYTHCVPSKSFMEERNEKEFHAFIDAIESREYYQDSELQGFWLRNNCASDKAPKASEWEAQTIFNLLGNRKFYRSFVSQGELKIIRTKIYKEEHRLKAIENKQKALGKLNTKTDTKKEILQKKSETVKKGMVKRKIKELYKELCALLSKRPDLQTELIVFRNVNKSKSNLGAHNEILDVFTSAYKYAKIAQEDKE